MRWQAWMLGTITALGAAALSSSRAFAQADEFFLQPVQAESKKEKDKPPPQPPDLSFLQPPREEIRPTLNPPMIGDNPGSSVLRSFTVTTLTDLGDGIFARVTDTYLVQALQVARGSFKICENESPRPIDRCYLNYNYFNGIRARPVSSAAEGSIGTARGPNAPPFTVPEALTSARLEPASLHRATLGFEKTFLGGDASLGLRVPLLRSQQTTSLDLSQARAGQFFAPLGQAFVGSTQAPGFAGPEDDTSLGDLSVILKFAPINDRHVLSFGMVITIPTGEDDLSGALGFVPHSTLLQPYLGYLRDWGRFFIHGFSSLVVPTDVREPTLFFNDVGLTWRLYEDPQAFISGVLPTVEAHVTTPLNHRDPRGTTSASDLVVLTGGLYVLLGDRTTLAVGVGTPVNGPRLFETEAAVQLNFRY